MKLLIALLSLCHVLNAECTLDEHIRAFIEKTTGPIQAVKNPTKGISDANQKMIVEGERGTFFVKVFKDDLDYKKETQIPELLGGMAPAVLAKNDNLKAAVYEKVWLEGTHTFTHDEAFLREVLGPLKQLNNIEIGECDIDGIVEETLFETIKKSFNLHDQQGIALPMTEKERLTVQEYTKILESIFKTLPLKRGLVHNDLNTNNILREKQTGKVYFIDWETVTISYVLCNTADLINMLAFNEKEEAAFMNGLSALEKHVVNVLRPLSHVYHAILTTQIMKENEFSPKPEYEGYTFYDWEKDLRSGKASFDGHSLSYSTIKEAMKQFSSDWFQKSYEYLREKDDLGA